MTSRIILDCLVYMIIQGFSVYCFLFGAKVALIRVWS